MNLLRQGKCNVKIEDFAARGFLNFANQTGSTTEKVEELKVIEMARRPSKLKTFTSLIKNNSMTFIKNYESSKLTKMMTHQPRNINNGAKADDQNDVDNSSFRSDIYFGYTKDPTKFCYPRRIIENRELGPTEIITVIKNVKEQESTYDTISGSPPPVYNPNDDKYLNSHDFSISDAQAKLVKLSSEEKLIIKTIREMKENELRRLAKEFLTNQIFNVRHKNHINQIVRAMFGEEKYEMEFNKLLISLSKKSD